MTNSSNPIPALLLKFTALIALLFLSACQTVKPPAPPAYHTDLNAAIKFITDDLAAQISSRSIAASKGILVDLFFDEYSAEEATASKNLQKELIATIGPRLPNIPFSPLNTRNIQNAEWVVLASYATLKSEQAGKAGNWVRLKLVLADIKTGASVAQVMTYLDAKQFNGAPSRFYKDAPMYLTDAAHQDRKAVLAGEHRPLQGNLLSRAEIGDAIATYEAGQYADAESRFRRVLELTPGHTGALSGLYQVLWSQGKKAEAEKVFTQLAAAGIDAGKLTIKLLFRLATTEFIDEGDMAQQYQVWLKAIARTVVDKKTCLDVTGHASASGQADYNERLSLARATRIIGRMQSLAPTTGGQLKPYGKGSSATIVGTGANDATDAIDRRVEFAVRPCA